MKIDRVDFLVGGRDALAAIASNPDIKMIRTEVADNDLTYYHVEWVGLSNTDAVIAFADAHKLYIRWQDCSIWGREFEKNKYFTRKNKLAEMEAECLTCLIASSGGCWTCGYPDMMDALIKALKEEEINV